MTRLFSAAALALFLVGAAALAQEPKPVRQYQEHEMTEAELRAARSSDRKYRMDTWQEETPLLKKEARFPWRAVALGALVLLIATPIAWNAYRQTSHELKGGNAIGGNPRRRSKG